MSATPTMSDLRFSLSPWDQEIAWARSTYTLHSPLLRSPALGTLLTLFSMAYHEMRLLLAKVMFNFDLELCPESEGWTEQEVYTLWQKKPLMVKLKATNTI
jgi:hypothetical protein